MREVDPSNRRNNKVRIKIVTDDLVGMYHRLGVENLGKKKESGGGACKRGEGWPRML